MGLPSSPAQGAGPWWEGQALGGQDEELGVPFLAGREESCRLTLGRDIPGGTCGGQGWFTLGSLDLGTWKAKVRHT